LPCTLSGSNKRSKSATDLKRRAAIANPSRSHVPRSSRRAAASKAACQNVATISSVKGKTITELPRQEEDCMVDQVSCVSVYVSMLVYALILFTSLLSLLCSFVHVPSFSCSLSVPLRVSVSFSLSFFLYIALVFSCINLIPLASLYASKSNTTARK